MSNTPQSTGSRFRILIVDDDAEILDLLTNWLANEGHEIVIARSADEALRRMEQSPPDLILLDLMAPSPDGLQILRKVKESSATAATQVVMMSVERDISTKIECLNNNADAFIAKPFHFDELDAILRSCLRRSEETRRTDRYAERLKRLSVTDERTGLFNERHLMARIQHEFEVSYRYRTDLSVMMLDLDHFKRVNDNHGHECGDLVLREFASLLTRNARNIDIVGRFGGEEFLMILRNTDAVRAAIVGERVRRSAESKVYEYKGQKLQVNVSVGIASVPTNSDVKTHLDFIRAADDALRRAKGSRNKVMVDSQSLPKAIFEGNLSGIFQAFYEDRERGSGSPPESESESASTDE